MEYSIYAPFDEEKSIPIFKTHIFNFCFIGYKISDVEFVVIHQSGEKFVHLVWDDSISARFATIFPPSVLEKESCKQVIIDHFIYSDPQSAMFKLINFGIDTYFLK